MLSVEDRSYESAARGEEEAQHVKSAEPKLSYHPQVTENISPRGLGKEKEERKGIVNIIRGKGEIVHWGSF